jgi:hypothetical protein
VRGSEEVPVSLQREDQAQVIPILDTVAIGLVYSRDRHLTSSGPGATQTRIAAGGHFPGAPLADKRPARSAVTGGYGRFLREGSATEREQSRQSDAGDGAKRQRIYTRFSNASTAMLKGYNGRINDKDDGWTMESKGDCPPISAAGLA